MDDQVTVKVHKFTKKYIDEIITKLTNAGINFKSEKALYSVAVLRLHDEAKSVDWKDKKAVDEFVEGLLNELYYLQDHKIVKTSMRGFSQK